MLVYVSVFLITIFLSVLEMKIEYLRIGGWKVPTFKLSFFFIFICLLVIGMARSEWLGADTLNYKIYYWDIFQKLDFVSVLKQDTDFGFGLVNWIVSKMTENYWIFRAVIFVCTFGLFSSWIYKHSKNAALSFFLYIALGFLKFDYTILRQALAVSITVWCFDYIIERQPIKFLVTVILAACFHKTALIMLIIYPLLNKKIEKMRFILNLSYYLLALFFAALGGQAITSIYKRQDYTEYVVRGEGYNLLVFYLIIGCSIYFVSRNIIHDEQLKRKLAFLTPIICFQIVSTGFSLFTRMLYYMNAYLLILIPDIMEKVDAKTKTAIFLFVLAAFSVLFYFTYYDSDIVPYCTHWSV